jgi:hypothetical protein
MAGQLLGIRATINSFSEAEPPCCEHILLRRQPTTTLFHILVTWSSSFYGSGDTGGEDNPDHATFIYTVKRRFSSWERLHKQHFSSLPELAALFPARCCGCQGRDEIVAYRMASLGAYLSHLLKMSVHPAALVSICEFLQLHNPPNPRSARPPVGALLTKGLREQCEHSGILSSGDGEMARVREANEELREENASFLEGARRSEAEIRKLKTHCSKLEGDLRAAREQAAVPRKSTSPRKMVKSLMGLRGNAR